MNIDSGVDLTSLKVDGGMVHNELLMQFQADVLDVPVIRPTVAGRRRSARRTRPGSRSASGRRSRTCGPTGARTRSGAPDGRGRAGQGVPPLEEGRDPDSSTGSRARRTSRRRRQPPRRPRRPPERYPERSAGDGARSAQSRLAPLLAVGEVAVLLALAVPLGHGLTLGEIGLVLVLAVLLAFREVAARLPLGVGSSSRACPS